MKTKRGVICSLAALAVLLAVVVVVARWDVAKAATFNPTVDVTLSDNTAGANADVTYEFSIPGGDANYDLNIAFTPAEFELGAGIPVGAYVADLDALSTLGLLNNPCQTGLAVSFEMLNASVDTADTVPFDDTYVDMDANTLLDGVEKYPDFLNTLFPGLTPTVRMFGATSAAGTAVTMNMVFFEPGTTLYGIEFDAALGRPSVQVLNDPTLLPSPTPITDFCTPLSAAITTFGVSKTDSEVTAVGGGDVVSTNPATGDDYTFKTYTTSLRDADDDGLDNSLDTCPYDVDTGQDDDYDGLDNACDPDPAVASAGLDEDGDGYMNRGDNCPLDANPGNADADGDTIGDDCDDHPNDADAEGESIEVYLEDTVTIVGAPEETPTPTVVPEEGALENCPQAGKWAIAVWNGDDGTDAEQAFATCGEGAVIAAYDLDPETQAWSRWFAGQPEISNLLTLDNMQGVIALAGAGAAAAGSAGSSAQQDAMQNCPQAGKWAISVWSGDDGTDASQAFATCAEADVVVAYSIDPDTQAWSRWFADRPEISNLLTLDDMQGVIALGGTEAPEEPDTPDLAAGWTKIEPGGDTICSLGTPYVYYVHPGTVNRLAVYFQGGGACWNDTTCSLTDPIFEETTDDSDNPENFPTGLADLDNPDNPFKDWFLVFVPYCTADVHWGDNTQTYPGDITIHHKGFVNVSAVLDWIEDNFEQPEKIFVTGCSAGSVGSIMGAAHIHALYPDVPLYQLGDSFAGVITDDFLQDGLPNWGAVQNLPDWIPALQVPWTELTLAKLYIALANYYSDDRWSQYNTAHDENQTFWYSAMGGTGDWGQLMLANIQEIQDAAPNFHSYTAPGEIHCITDKDIFYTREVEGVLFSDWVEAMVNDEAWDDVMCTDCETDPEAP